MYSHLNSVSFDERSFPKLFISPMHGATVLDVKRVELFVLKSRGRSSNFVGAVILDEIKQIIISISPLLLDDEESTKNR